jgi:hypothetical protein
MVRSGGGGCGRTGGPVHHVGFENGALDRLSWHLVIKQVADRWETGLITLTGVQGASVWS